MRIRKEEKHLKKLPSNNQWKSSLGIPNAFFYYVLLFV